MTFNQKLLLPSLLATLSVQGMIAFAMITLPVLLPAYAAELGVTAAFAGTATAMVYAGAAITAMALSGRARILGALRTCQIGLLATGLGLSLASTGSVPALLGGALAIGLGYGPVTAASAVLLTRHAPPSAYALVFSLNRTSIPLGAALSGALLPTLSIWIGWRGSLRAVGAGCVLLALYLCLYRHLDGTDGKKRSTVPPNSPFGAMRALFTHPKRRTLTQASIAFLAAQSCLASFTVAFLVTELSVSYAKAGGLLAAAQIAGVTARLVVGFAADRVQRGTALIGALGVGMSAATGLAALAAPDWPHALVVAIFLLYGATALGWNGVMLAELARTTTPEGTGEIAGASSAIAFAGAVAGPALFAYLLTAIGYAGAYGVLCGCVLVCSTRLLRFVSPSPAKDRSNCSSGS